MSTVAAEYDVLVNLKAGREGQKAIASQGRSMRSVLKQAERDQNSMRKAETVRIKQAERDELRRINTQERARKGAQRKNEAAEKAAAREAAKQARLREREARRLEAAATKRRADMGRGALGTTNGAGGVFGSVGTGGAAGWARQAGAVITGILAGAVAAGLGTAFSRGLEDNIGREALTGKIGTTLQLFDFNAVDAAGKPLDMQAQFDENISNARWYQDELQRIADQSPGDIGQVTDLFSGILPGMAAITQDAERINDVTQKTTLLAAVLGNQFALVGEQSSRILSGGAGAEMETWRTALQKPIRDAGILDKTFKKTQGLGESLTMAFNKLAPEKRLELFEKALTKLGKPVSDYFENSWDGIMSQAQSSLMMLRRELGRPGFEMVKGRVKELNKGGILKRGSAEFKNLMDFSGFLGQRIGGAMVKAIDIAETTTTAIANNWQSIVLHAQTASHYLVSGAKLAVGLMGARAGAGLAAGGASAVLGGVGAIASTTATIGQLGMAAAVALPAIAAMGIVAGGFGILFGGSIAYIVSNIDTLSAQFMAWAQTSSDVIDPFFKSIDDLSAKFLAVGEYLLGGGEAADVFTTITEGATWAIETMTSVFSELIGMTASLIETFAGAADFLTGIINPGKSLDALRLSTAISDRELISAAGGKIGDASYDAATDRIAELQERTMSYSEKAAGVVSTIRGAKGAFDNAKGGRDPSALSWMAYDKMYPIGPAQAPTNRSSKTPPKVNVKQTNYHTWNVRDTDPNAIVAGFNKVNAQKAAQPIKSALAAVRRR